MLAYLDQWGDVDGECRMVSGDALSPSDLLAVMALECSWSGSAEYAEALAEDACACPAN